MFLRKDTKDYKTFDYLRDKLADLDRWAFATKPQYADILLVFTVESQTLGTITTKRCSRTHCGGRVRERVERHHRLRAQPVGPSSGRSRRP